MSFEKLCISAVADAIYDADVADLDFRVLSRYFHGDNATRRLIIWDVDRRMACGYEDDAMQHKVVKAVLEELITTHIDRVVAQ